MSKMSLAQKALSKTRLYLRKYSATALACGAAAGVIATAIMAVRATPKAIELIKADSREKYSGKEDSYTKLEAFKSSWKCYIPSAAVGLATISCILGANLLNKRQQAAVASTCALLSSAYKEYKDKVKRLYGEETHRNIINSIAVEKCKDVNITAGSIIISSSLNFKEDKEPEITRTFYDSFYKIYL